MHRNPDGTYRDVVDSEYVRKDEARNRRYGRDGKWHKHGKPDMPADPTLPVDTAVPAEPVPAEKLSVEERLTAIEARLTKLEGGPFSLAQRDAQGNLTHDENGDLVRDARGRNVFTRGGRLVNQDGQWVDEAGRVSTGPVFARRFRRGFMKRHYPEGVVIDQSGFLIDGNGNYVDEKGAIVTAPVSARKIEQADRKARLDRISKGLGTGTETDLDNDGVVDVIDRTDR